ncbi:unnamed protein product [Diatraea saccharalis]|uniref:Uncharacterized protein n=1 Tax=Diatraea saccharalis TaxID=40085 RepID=A0A9N9WE03_9NEOP|nr:unnamed protein product [Diatraea saccharalis]
MNHYNGNVCRICLQSKGTLFSLFKKIKDCSPYEKIINTTKIKLNIESGPSSICSQCLKELEMTAVFLQKFERSNEILAAKCSDIDSLNEVLKSASDHDEDEAMLDENIKDSALEIDAAKCPECGSLRRCKHWAPLTTHTCNICQKIFTRKFNFKLHLKRHLGEKEWPCPKCGVRQLTQWLARRHCEPRPRRPCPVSDCDKSFTTNTNLNNHIRTHYGERPYTCTECGKTFTTKNTLNDHSRIHTGVKPYMCPICGRQFATNKLSGHMRAHCGARPHSCPVPACARSFSSRRAAAAHARTHAGAGAGGVGAGAGEGARAHACAWCPAAYAHAQSLRKHRRQRHAG